MSYPNPRPYHLAKSIRCDGAVTAACFKRPRRINLSKASWTNRPEAVTCKKCLAMIRESHDRARS